MSLDLLSRILRLERRLDSLAKPEIGWTPHFLTTPYTHASFNGDSYSDVAANTIIDNAGWSTTIPATAKALMITCMCRDSGSAATTDLYVALYSTAAAATATAAIRPSSKANDDYEQQGPIIIPCTDGDIWYRVNASGATTMDIWLWCFGWWE